MQKLNLPPFPFRIKKQDDNEYIFDACRRKFVRLTPEEWVRQNFTEYLILHKHFPRGRMTHELNIKLFQLSRRVDTVVYDAQGKPLVIIEYKAPHIKITQETFNQAVRYNMVLKVPFIIISNGIQHYACQLDYEQNKVSYLSEIPHFNRLTPLPPNL